MNLIYNKGVYVIAVGDAIKVGMSSDLRGRFTSARTWIVPGKGVVVGVIFYPEEGLRDAERNVHKRLSALGQHLELEWFSYSPESVQALEEAGIVWMNAPLSENF